MGAGLILAMMLAMQGASSAAPRADSAPPVMLTMVSPSAVEGAPLRQPQGDGYVCASSYAMCMRIVAVDGEPAQLELFDMDAAATDIPALTLPIGADADEGRSLALWGRVIRLPMPPDSAGRAPAFLIGILSNRTVGYSGGGGGGTRLALHELIVGNGAAQLGREVLSLPWDGSLLIRACFSEADSALRLGACHDDYNFGASLTLAPAQSDGGMPLLRYETQASAYPRTARRMADSSGTQLRQADLVRWRDPACSYTRTLRFNPASERYEMDRPAPDCSNYTVP
jgi:hypothetical protein